MGLFGTVAGAYVLGGLLGEEKSGLSDLGPAPIGSDPWLRSHVQTAIAREVGADATGLVVEAKVEAGSSSHRSSGATRSCA